MMDFCSQCKYHDDCPDAARPAFVGDLPLEVMIEVEPRCNFRCRFCFNRYSFARQGRNVASLTTEQIEETIDHIAAFGIKTVRFTGGEPLLRADLLPLMVYAKRKKLEILLNTNGYALERRMTGKFGRLVDNVLMPIESWNNKKESALAGAKDALLKKISSLVMLRRAGVPILRVGTVATKENIDNFDKLAALMLNLPIDQWEFYRPVTDGGNSSLSARSITALVEKIEDFRQRTKIKLMIANAIPFCAIRQSADLCRVSAGALFEDGHNRLVVDPRGFFKPHYFIDKKLASVPDIKAAWNHPFMVKMRSLKLLPRMCRDCRFKEKCRGGSRFRAKTYGGDWRAPDPLARPKNKLVFVRRQSEKS